MSGVARVLLIRRPLGAPDDQEQLTYYLTFAPVGTPIEALVAVAGQRWNIEEGFERAKGEVGLGHYEVRHWTGRYCHIALAMLAPAYWRSSARGCARQKYRRERGRRDEACH